MIFYRPPQGALFGKGNGFRLMRMGGPWKNLSTIGAMLKNAAYLPRELDRPTKNKC